MIKEMGLKGAAVASTLADIICTCQYLIFLKHHDYLSSQVSNFKKYLRKIFNTGLLIQIRNVAIKISYFLVVRRIITFDTSGTLDTLDISDLFDTLDTLDTSDTFDNSDTLDTLDSLHTSLRLLRLVRLMRLIRQFSLIRLIKLFSEISS